ncbi:competence protein ComER [Cytobacillus horneckiae]|uniref:Pyrroline-5-carboxylate reductase n=1 Tax=Cytobacillus horneckiae TaxID=549687 RepID=A0A2N0ZIC8_9BACI|nr:late competence protein ComER [Cytobacillus horneckiae]NRG44608.1 late competence protein ComER [Bacillus sp. CRN 9]MBN6888942.1 late competence protein ComER [Cytobacillus horneckiae]MCM3179877.1 late competence protein ComER [Cytobacillus horneckiae]MEC1155266.1 late competence protein ComER [Cytobacillus horneckiae]MED2936681.1 late competence protein ComER [Cytobacillus horneckiae]
MKIGMIGTGNMGRILAEAMLDSKAVSPSSMTITNRSVKKALQIKKVYTEVNVAADAITTAKNASLIFICVKPHDVYHVIKRISPYLTKDKCVVSITSPISVKQMESVVPCSTARVIPSITNRALAGVSLVSFGEQCEQSWIQKIKLLFEHISIPVEINEEITRVASDIVSCGPAFFSFLTQKFIEAAVSETEIDAETATKLASEMLIGLGELLRQGHYTLPTLQEKVCVKGGVTGEGIKVMEAEIGEMFEHLFQATHAKFDEDIENVKKQYTTI